MLRTALGMANVHRCEESFLLAACAAAEQSCAPLVRQARSQSLPCCTVVCCLHAHLVWGSGLKAPRQTARRAAFMDTASITPQGSQDSASGEVAWGCSAIKPAAENGVWEEDNLV